MKWFGKQRDGAKPKIAPAKIGLGVFLAFCIGILAWDISQNGLRGSLTAEQPVAKTEVGDPLQPSLPVLATPQEPEEEDSSASGNGSLFAAYRMDRESSRSEELALLQSIIDDEGGSPTIREEAEQRRLVIAANIEQEAYAESLLAAKDFGETVVLVSSDQATVICSVDLDAVKATQIAEIVASSCNVSFENVVIVNK